MIAIIDYKAGNIRSVENALKRLGAEYVLTANPETIRRADHVILPGVGEASSAMASLEETGLVPVIKSLTQPVLGICVGVQLMCSFSEEGGVECMGIFKSKVTRFPEASGVKIPHTGWNTTSGLCTFQIHKMQPCRAGPLKTFRHLDRVVRIYFLFRVVSLSETHAPAADYVYGRDYVKISHNSTFTNRQSHVIHKFCQQTIIL